ncbi:hypothetical protein BGZ49_005766 [Haplosporangium sp. Z 27]|nr:hypothetical protein BGZ49_005766 [Haplosporangium sp. Z 27]
MRPTTELIRIWTQALVPVCNNSKSHASQEVKWLLQHAKEQVIMNDNSETESRRGGNNNSIDNNNDDIRPRDSRAEISKTEVSLMQEYVRQRIEDRKPLQYILDICTGSGCIPLGLASVLPPKSCNAFGIDIHPKAVQLAKENEFKNRSLLNENKVQFFQADLLDSDAVDTFSSWIKHSKYSSDNNNISHTAQLNPLPQTIAGYSLITSNPPYIAHSEYDTLEAEVARWEDPKALLADQEGLMFYPQIAKMAMELLYTRQDQDISSSIASHINGNTIDFQSSERQWRNGPVLDKVRLPELVFEIGGDHQVNSVTAAVREAGFSRVEVWKDLADRARCIVGAR